MQCPRCGFDHSFRTCPNCGLRSEEPPPPPELPPPPSHGAAGDGRRGLPWDRREELGTIPAALETIKGVLFSPATTFREMSLTGGLVGPFLFGLVLVTLGFWASLVYDLAMNAMGMSNPLMRGLPGADSEVAGGVAAMAGGVFCMGVAGPFVIAGILFLGAGIHHVLLMLMGGARQGFEATFRVFAFALGAAAPFDLIPVCGQWIGAIWAVVATIIGLKEAHGTDTWRAVCAVLLPAVLCCTCLVAAMFGAAILAALGLAAATQ